MYEFSDEWGPHRHEIRGAPYDHRAPVTCASCILRLDSRMKSWLEELTKRHKLPPKFWVGYKFSWE